MTLADVADILSSDTNDAHHVSYPIAFPEGHEAVVPRNYKARETALSAGPYRRGARMQMLASESKADVGRLLASACEGW